MKNTKYTYDYFLDAFREAKLTAKNLVEVVSDDTFTKKLNEKKWSMAQILDHLNHAGEMYFIQVQKALDKPDENLKHGHEPFTPGFIFRWFIFQVSPENPSKLPTVSSFKPIDSSSADKEKILSDFIRLQDEFIRVIKKAKIEQLDLDGIKHWNPIVKIVPMSLTSFFGVIEAHQRRHFEQMKRLKEHFTINLRG